MWWLLIAACAGPPAAVDDNEEDVAHETGTSPSDSGGDDPPVASSETSGCKPGAWYGDADGDGYGDASTLTLGCRSDPTGTKVGGDCDDADPEVHPAATERCFDGDDDDCDGAAAPCEPSPEYALPDAAFARLHGTVASSDFGRLAVGPGDLNGDGLADVATAAPGTDAHTDDQGVAYVFFGPVRGDRGADVADVVIEGPKRIGNVVASAGDLNGDGNADLLVADYGSYLISVKDAGPVLMADDAFATIEWSAYGWGVGDATGDGKDDVMLANATDGSGGEFAGRLWLFDGPVSGRLQPDAADGTITGQPHETLGQYPAVHLDADGDGRQDVAIRVLRPYEDDSAGTTLVFGEVPGDVSTADADAVIVGTDEGEDAGNDLAFAGDVDGDGYDDLFLGSCPTRPPYSSDEVDHVAALVTGPLSGSISLSSAMFRLRCLDPIDCVNPAVAGLGDLDGDGKDDLAVGTQIYRDATGYSVGAVWLLVNPPEGTSNLEDVATTKILGESPFSGAGEDLTGPGDVDGDGVPDILAGGEYFTWDDPVNGPQGGAGAMWLISGAGL